MSRYRKVDVRVWSDEKFRRLSPMQPCGQGLWLWLLTNKRTTIIPGLYEVGELEIAESLGWDLKGFREAFQEAFHEGLAKADWAARLMWIPNAIKYDPPANPNVVKSWGTVWDEIPECDLKYEAHEKLHSYLSDISNKNGNKSWLEAFLKACPKGSGKGI